MPQLPHRTTMLRPAVVVALVVALLGLHYTTSVAHAAPTDQQELSEVQRKLDAVRQVLTDARADADDIARALVQADRDVKAARVALDRARRRYEVAHARDVEAGLEADRAKLEADAQQAVIDRRARATYMNNAPSAMLTLVIDAESVVDLLDRTKLLGDVAKAANAELTDLVSARSRAEAARQRAAAAERRAREQHVRMRERAAALEEIRAARAAARDALQRKVAFLQVRQGTLRKESTRILESIQAEEAARRARIAAARRAGVASQAGAAGPTVLANDGDGGGSPSSESYQRLTPTAKRLYGLVVRVFDVSAIGGWRPTGSVPGSDHPRGRALDISIGYPSSSGQALGWQLANWAATNAGALEVKYVIFNGRIWTPGRGWHDYRHPSDPCNCNPTLRHDDHVHISVQT